MVKPKKQPGETLAMQRHGSQVGHPTLKPKLAAALDKSVIMPEEDPKAVLNAVEALGMSVKRWSDIKLRAVQDFGRYMGMKMTARISLVSTFQTLDEIEYAMQVSHEIAADPDNSLEQRIAAARMITTAADAHRMMTAHMVELADRGQDRTVQSGPNRAPVAPLQVTSGGGPILVEVRSGQNPGQRPAEPVSRGQVVETEEAKPEAPH